MSNQSRSRKPAAPTLWGGPTPQDILMASGRKSMLILFVSTGRGPRRELAIQIGEAFVDQIDKSVNFKGRTADGKFAISGRLDGSRYPVALATIERQLIPWAARKAS